MVRYGIHGSRHADIDDVYKCDEASVEWPFTSNIILDPIVDQRKPPIYDEEIDFHIVKEMNENFNNYVCNISLFMAEICTFEVVNNCWDISRALTRFQGFANNDDIKKAVQQIVKQSDRHIFFQPSTLIIKFGLEINRC